MKKIYTMKKKKLEGKKNSKLPSNPIKASRLLQICNTRWLNVISLSTCKPWCNMLSKSSKWELGFVRYIKVWGTCNTYTYPTVKMGWILDRFCNKYPLSRPRTSIWNVCSNPPPNPTEQDTDNPWVVWLWTSQFWGGSGGPEIKTKI